MGIFDSPKGMQFLAEVPMTPKAEPTEEEKAKAAEEADLKKRAEDMVKVMKMEEDLVKMYEGLQMARADVIAKSPLVVGLSPAMFSPGLQLGGTAGLTALLRAGGPELVQKQLLLNEWIARQDSRYALLSATDRATLDSYKQMARQLDLLQSENARLSRTNQQLANTILQREADAFDYFDDGADPEYEAELRRRASQRTHLPHQRRHASAGTHHHHHSHNHVSTSRGAARTCRDCAPPPEHRDCCQHGDQGRHQQHRGSSSSAMSPEFARARLNDNTNAPYYRAHLF